MKHWTFLLVMVALLVLVGCVSKEVKKEVHTQRVTLGAYIDNAMTKNKTSQRQDQSVVKENYKTLLILDWHLNDDKEAKKILDDIKKKEKEAEKPAGGDSGGGSG